MATTHRMPLSSLSMRLKGEGTMITCGRHHHARATAFSWAAQRFVEICRSTSTLLEVSRTTCWRRQGQSTSRERRMAMLAGARSLHARPWERRYTHALGRWFERGRLNAQSGDREGTAVSPRSPGGHPGEPTGRFRRFPFTATKGRNARGRMAKTATTWRCVV